MKITTDRHKVLDTLEYFLERYLKAAEGHKDSSGLEGVVIVQFIEQLRWIRQDHKRLSELNKPRVIGAEDGKEE
tara:strand:+ start:219 stop:440 length:222 start_codon:yes stop_codon:yes gene_type:complete